MFSSLFSLDLDETYVEDALGWSHSWRAASSGVMRFLGSHSRHLLTKSMNTVSLQRSACEIVLDAGFRLRPLELVMHLGVPLESKNNLLLVAVLMRSSGGWPSTSIIQANCSTSFSPGNSGYPVYSSASIHPKLHISIGVPYDSPSMTSGDR